MADREKSIAALVTVLQAVDTVKAVTREFKTIKEIAATAFPTIIIEDDGREEIEYKTGDFADIKFTISIIGYVSKAKNTTTAVNELDVETKKALGVDFLSSTGVMRSAGVSGFRILPLVERSGSEIAPYGFFEREIELTYESQLSLGL